MIGPFDGIFEVLYLSTDEQLILVFCLYVAVWDACCLYCFTSVLTTDWKLTFRTWLLSFSKLVTGMRGSVQHVHCHIFCHLWIKYTFLSKYTVIYCSLQRNWNLKFFCHRISGKTPKFCNHNFYAHDKTHYLEIFNVLLLAPCRPWYYQPEPEGRKQEWGCWGGGSRALATKRFFAFWRAQNGSPVAF